MESALENVADGVLTTDAADNVLYMNAAAQSLTGWRIPDAVGMPLADVFSIVHAGNSEAVDWSIDAVRHNGDTERVLRHAVLVGAKGRAVLIEYGASAIRDAGGTFSGAVLVFRDFTYRREAELALQTSEETLLANAQALFEEKERAQVTLNSIGDAVISTDFRGRVNFLNIVAEKMTGWSQTDASGKLIDEIFLLVDSSTREQVPCPTMRAIIENRTVGMEAKCVLIRRDGVEIAVEDSASPIRDKHGGVIGAVMVAHDVTVARDLSGKLARLALHDNLTDLPNRALFADRLDQALVRARRSGKSVGLLFVDLDRFKPVNDTLGHGIGDGVLRAVARRLLTCVRNSDTVSRYGGDEFIILLADVASPQDAAVCADKVLRAFAAPYEIEGHALALTASIGIAMFPEDAADAGTLLRYADIAMYQAKFAGRDNYQIFNSDMVAAAVK